MPFEKGKSGNPGGRPKEIGDLRQLAKKRTTSAIKTLVEIMLNKKSPAAARVNAACALLDRGYGRPVQMTELTGKDRGPLEFTEANEAEYARRIAYALTSAAHTDQDEHTKH